MLQLREYFRVYLVQTNPLRKNLRNFLFSILRSIVYGRRVDAIFVEFLAHHAFIIALFRLLGIIKRKPIIVRCHRFEVYNFAKRFWPAFRLAALMSDFVICVSKRTYERLVSLLPEMKKKAIIIYNGVDVDRFRPIYVEKEKNIVVGSLGALIPRKGFLELIRCIEGLIRENVEIKLRIGGKGPLRDKIQKYLREHDLEGYVILDGFIPDEELVRWYNSIDVFVLNSKSEGHPMVVLEAMSCGLHVIATLVDDLDEILDKKWLYRFGDWERLKHLLREATTMDRETVEKIGKTNRKIVLERFNLKKQAMRIAKVIEYIIARHRH